MRLKQALMDLHVKSVSRIRTPLTLHALTLGTLDAAYASLTARTNGPTSFILGSLCSIWSKSPRSILSA